MVHPNFGNPKSWRKPCPSQKKKKHLQSHQHSWINQLRRHAFRNVSPHGTPNPLSLCFESVKPGFADRSGLLNTTAYNNTFTPIDETNTSQQHTTFLSTPQNCRATEKPFIIARFIEPTSQRSSPPPLPPSTPSEHTKKEKESLISSQVCSANTPLVATDSHSAKPPPHPRPHACTLY